MATQKSKINTPTILTLLRIVLVAPLMILLFEPAPWAKFLALVIFIVASITDLIDGKMARKNNQVTDLGAFLDPLADKMLVNLTIFALTLQGVFDPWFFPIILIRDFAVDGMRMMVAKTGETVSASIWGKAKTMTQMIIIGIILFETGLFMIPEVAAATPEWIFNIAINFGFIGEFVILFLTVFSGAQYLIDGYKKAIK